MILSNLTDPLKSIFNSLTTSMPFPRALENLSLLFEKGEQLATSLLEPDNLTK
jgi:hypothetical protein